MNSRLDTFNFAKASDFVKTSKVDQSEACSPNFVIVIVLHRFQRSYGLRYVRLCVGYGCYMFIYCPAITQQVEGGGEWVGGNSKGVKHPFSLEFR